MKNRFIRSLLAFSLVASIMPVSADAKEFSFAVMFHPHEEESGEPAMRDTINRTDELNLSFVVANGIKSASEPCDDSFYEHRKSLLDDAKNGVIVSLAGSDWAECKSANGKSAAVERLTRMRELFFADDFSLGGSKIPLTRQSAIAKFRIYPENTRWEFDNVLFATLNLPSNNNHYSSQAGRNSEFDDRLIANKDWLQRIFAHATRKKRNGIVLFFDGDALQKNKRPEGGRDGFSEIRKSLTTLAVKFPGKVLIVHSRTGTVSTPDKTEIVWKANLGTLNTQLAWVRLDVDTGSPELFAVANELSEAKNTHHSRPLR
jgi:hypothetical protein